MPRPKYPVKKAHALLEEWIAFRVPKSPSDAPITVTAAVVYLVSRGLPTHRDTLHKHGLRSSSAPARTSRDLVEAGPMRMLRVSR